MQNYKTSSISNHLLQRFAIAKPILIFYDPLVEIPQTNQLYHFYLSTIFYIAYSSNL